MFSAVVAFALALPLLGCNGESPTAPGVVVVRITSIAPGGLQPSGGPQTITVSGDNFQQGLTLYVTSPSNGVTTAITGGQIQFVDPHSFQATILVDVPGTYLLAVRNANGDESSTFQLIVGSNVPLTPSITGLSPISLQRSAQSVLVTLSGVNFDPNVFVTVIDPNSIISTLQTSQLLTVTSTSIQFLNVFSARGSYSISVTNQLGEVSNSVVVSVQ